MKTLNANTKQAQRFIAAYNRSSIQSISEAYCKPSFEKIAIFDQLSRRAVHEENGRDIRIIGYNSSYFTMAWTTDAGLRVETWANSYLIKNPEL